MRRRRRMRRWRGTRCRCLENGLLLVFLRWLSHCSEFVGMPLRNEVSCEVVAESLPVKVPHVIARRPELAGDAVGASRSRHRTSPDETQMLCTRVAVRRACICTMTSSTSTAKRKADDRPISPPPVKRKLHSGTTSGFALCLRLLARD